ncbi:MAG: SDR family NAD(P)-dependent oxidoreductase, partial [Nonomuraea sp.]|nr:SDR family NAD(P)-dependent oxidoreductase [Nonomuraea sp.]
MGVFDLSGRTALVTGASKGIGRAISLAYAAAGADVALVSRSAESLAEVGKEIEALGRRAVVVPADLTDRDAAASAAAAAIDGLGHLDIVVNNAGGSNFLVEFK